MKKPKKFDTFLYRHFKSNSHSPSKIVIQPVEKIIYDPNSSTRLKNLRDMKLNLNGLNYYNNLFFKALMIICTMKKATFLKCQILIIFFCFGM